MSDDAYKVEPAMDSSSSSSPDPQGHSGLNVNPSANNADCMNLFNVCCSGICFGLGECLVVFTGCLKGCGECCCRCCE